MPVLPCCPAPAPRLFSQQCATSRVCPSLPWYFLFHDCNSFSSQPDAKTHFMDMTSTLFYTLLTLLGGFAALELAAGASASGGIECSFLVLNSLSFITTSQAALARRSAEARVDPLWIDDFDVDAFEVGRDHPKSPSIQKHLQNTYPFHLLCCLSGPLPLQPLFISDPARMTINFARPTTVTSPSPFASILHPSPPYTAVIKAIPICAV